jgi:drug/metabolite transporter (DMT)-like permease
VGYLLLVLATVSYALGIVAQTVAAQRSEPRGGLDVGLLARLARDRVYLVGFGSQCLGFVLAFFARADLPLFLVQAGTSSAVGLATLVGAAFLGWRIRPLEIGVLIFLACGIVLLVGAAEPGPSHDLSTSAALALTAAAVVALLLAVPAGRVRGPRGAVVLGLLAGVEFAILAIASRPLAARPLLELLFEPTAWLMIASALAGQCLLAAGLQRGTATATVASMDSMTTVIASGFGLLVLGDLVAPGRVAWLLSGLVLVVIGVVAMSIVTGRVARPTEEEVSSPSAETASTPLRAVAQENQ